MLCQFTLLLLTSVAAVDHDLQYVAELRKLQFYRLSELQAEQLLARSDWTPQARSQIAVELSKTLAAQALNSRPPQRAAFWKRATDVLAQESQNQTDPATRLILRSQQAFVYEQQSAWSVREASAEAGGLPFVYLLKSTLLVMPALLILQGGVILLTSILILQGKPVLAEHDKVQEL